MVLYFGDSFRKMKTNPLEFSMKQKMLMMILQLHIIPPEVTETNPMVRLFLIHNTIEMQGLEKNISNDNSDPAKTNRMIEDHFKRMYLNDDQSRPSTIPANTTLLSKINSINTFSI